MEHIPAMSYVEMGKLVDDSLSEQSTIKEHFTIEIFREEYIFSFEACSICDHKTCLLFVALRPIYNNKQNDFSKTELEKYLYGK
ncbi:MAG: hypothetical protein RSB93_02115 [Rikenellaceae bacterium]